MVPTLTPAFIIPEGIGGGISGGGQNVALSAAGVVAAGVIVGGLVVVAAPVVAAVAAKASLLTAASPLGLLAVGAFVKGLEQFRDWGLVGWRPPVGQQAVDTGFEYTAPGSVDVNFVFSILTRTTSPAPVNCTTGVVGQPGNEVTGPSSTTLTAKSFTIGRNTRIVENKCGGSSASNVSGPSGFYIIGTTAAGGTVNRNSVVGDRVFFQSTQSVIQTTVREMVSITANGQAIDITPQAPQEFLGQVRPRLFPPTLPDAPLLPAPAVVPLTPVLPPAPPDRRPLAPPVTIPRPGQQPAQVPVPGPRPGPAPGPGPSPTPSQPAPAGVPAIGPLPLPIPLPVPTTPGSVVIVDGQPIGGPGQAPAPNLVAIAQELGRLERKNEILLSRPENGGLGEVAENAILGTLRSLLERLVTELLNDVPGGSFSLSHACPPSGGGDPLPPVVVPYGGGGNPTAGILAKLDGLAGLIQAHKTMRQPMCRTPLVGEEVTIHFESDG